MKKDIFTDNAFQCRLGEFLEQPPFSMSETDINDVLEVFTRGGNTHSAPIDNTLQHITHAILHLDPEIVRVADEDTGKPNRIHAICRLIMAIWGLR